MKDLVILLKQSFAHIPPLTDLCKLPTSCRRKLTVLRMARKAFFGGPVHLPASSPATVPFPSVARVLSAAQCTSAPLCLVYCCSLSQGCPPCPFPPGRRPQEPPEVTCFPAAFPSLHPSVSAMELTHGRGLAPHWCSTVPGHCRCPVVGPEGQSAGTGGSSGQAQDLAWTKWKCVVGELLVSMAALPLHLLVESRPWWLCCLSEPAK